MIDVYNYEPIKKSWMIYVMFLKKITLCSEDTKKGTVQCEEAILTLNSHIGLANSDAFAKPVIWTVSLCRYLSL